MLRVPIELAKPKMPLALPVHHPDNPARVLLHAGTELTGRAIERLSGQGVREVWITWPGLEFLRDHANPQLDQSHRQMTRTISRVFDRVADDAAVEADYSTLKQSIGAFMEKLMESPRASEFLSEILGAGAPLVRRSGAVCLMSLLMGLKLGGYLVRQRPRLSPRDATNIVNLGVGAMLHDIGMLHVPASAARAYYAHGDESDPAFREHVEIGHRLVSGRVDPTASATVLHHHQRYDGNGFPEIDEDDAIYGPCGRRGETIHVFPRIVAAADLYDRLRFGAEDAPVRPRVDALRAMHDAEHAGRLDPVVLEGLLAVTPPYPVGSVVTLTTGDNAVVTRWTHRDPCRPEVRVIGGLDTPPEDQTVGVTLDLSKRRDVAVARAEGFDVANANFTTSNPVAADAA
ncbi:MAG: HD domain-containing protein [Planctomycetota bacterium]|nr:MAG: HD domain-containing protein [Planctomycetota bacterium]